MMNRISFLKWLEKEIEKTEELTKIGAEDEKVYKNGFLHALEHIETIVQYGTFEEIVYVKLKDDRKVTNLNNNCVYESYSVDGGKYFEIYVEASGEIERFNRDLFEIIKIKRDNIKEG